MNLPSNWPARGGFLALAILMLSPGAAGADAPPDASETQPAPLVADPDPTAQGHLAAALKALGQAQAALAKANPANSSLGKAQADVNKALADVAEASTYVTAHPEIDKLPSGPAPAETSQVQPATIPTSNRAPYLKAALEALNAGLNEFINNQAQDYKGPVVNSIGGYREKIMADIAQASVDVLAGITGPAKSKAAAAGAKTSPLPAEVLDAVVIIRGDVELGTGFVAKLKGHFFIITNQHVLSGQTPSKITITGIDGVKYPANGQLFGARDYDVAIIKLPETTPPAHFLEVMDDPTTGVKDRDAVTVPGNAGGAGVVTQVNGQVLGIGPELVEVDAKTIQGNSGSPIIHRDSGKVIGLVTFATSTTLDDLKKAAGQPAVRWFGYRLDNITTWDQLDWNRFSEEGKKMDAIESTTSGLIAVLTGKATSDPVIIEAIQDYKIGLNAAGGNRNAQLEAVQAFANTLQHLSTADIDALSHTTLYPYHAKLYAEQKAVRAEISKALTDTQQILDSVHF